MRRVDDPTLLGLVCGAQHAQSGGAARLVADAFGLDAGVVDHGSASLAAPCHVLPESCAISVMITECHAPTSFVVATSPAAPGGRRGAPMCSSIGAFLGTGCAGSTPGKRMPSGMMGMPISSERRAAPRRPRSSWVALRLTLPSGKAPIERPAASSAPGPLDGRAALSVEGLQRVEEPRPRGFAGYRDDLGARVDEAHARDQLEIPVGDKVHDAPAPIQEEQGRHQDRLAPRAVVGDEDERVRRRTNVLEPVDRHDVPGGEQCERAQQQAIAETMQRGQRPSENLGCRRGAPRQCTGLRWNGPREVGSSHDKGRQAWV